MRRANVETNAGAPARMLTAPSVLASVVIISPSACDAGRRILGKRGAVEARKDHIGHRRRLGELLADGRDRYFGRLVQWITVDARTDRRERYRSQRFLFRESERLTIGRCEQPGLARGTSAPHRSHRMNDEASLQPEPGRDARLTGWAGRQHR